MTAIPGAATRSRLAVDLGAATVLALLLVHSVGTEPRTSPILYLPAVYLAAVTPALWRTDLAERRLPNRLVLPGLVVAAVSIAVAALLSGRIPWLALLAGGGYFVFLLVLGLAGGMGMGDVKLGALLGIAAGSLGPAVAVLSPVLAFTAGGIAGVVALVRRSRSIPFGPYLLGGFWAAVLLCALGGGL